MAMELDHSFTVPVPPDQAWDVLLDVERIAPCMPGATVESVEGDDVAGRLKVKVGPVSLTYKGTAKFTDRDPANRSVLVEASGKETRGAGTASATVKAALAPHDANGGGPAGGGQTLVTLHTTLNVTGRPAQFGRGVIAEVGSKLIGRFADNLAEQLSGGGGATPGTGSSGTAGSAGATSASAASTSPAAGATGTAEVTPPASGDLPASASPGAGAPTAQPPATGLQAAQAAPAQDDHLDLLSLVGPVLVKRLAPVAAAVTAAGLLAWGTRRIFRRRK